MNDQSFRVHNFQPTSLTIDLPGVQNHLSDTVKVQNGNGWCINSGVPEEVCNSLQCHLIFLVLLNQYRYGSLPMALLPIQEELPWLSALNAAAKNV